MYYQISIPYGAIKRERGTKNTIDKRQISIPYGAIKSIFNKVTDTTLFLFQFLMVRLKVCNVS